MLKKITTKEITMIALLTAFCVVGRMLTTWIPNVQPITATLILVALYMGGIQAMVIGALSILITNFYLGMGIWTIAQILSFWAIILVVVLLKRTISIKTSFFMQLVVSGLSGFFYGFLISVMLAPFFGVQNFWAYYITGMSFDMMHAFGTVFFYAILKKPFVHIIEKEINTKR